MRTLMMSLFRLLIFQSLTIVACAQATSEIKLPIKVIRQNEKFYLIAQPSVSELRAAMYDRSGNLIADTGVLTQTPFKWPVATMQGNQLPLGNYLCVLWLKDSAGTTKGIAHLNVINDWVALRSVENYLKDMELPDGLMWGSQEFVEAKRRTYARGTEATELFRVAIKVLPDEPVAYLFLVQAMQTKYSRTAIFLAPPPPPPPPPPPVTTGKKRTQRIIEKTEPEEPSTTPKDDVPSQPTPEEIREMIAASQKALSLSRSCEERVAAQQWLAVAQNESENHADYLATLEQVALAPCTTKEVQTTTWYTMGVHCWQCAYDLTSRYANRTLLTSNPFHYRNISRPADKRKFEDCWQKGTAYIGKALELKPDYAEAWFYQSLLYREKQKTTASRSESLQYATKAKKSVQHGTELFRKQRDGN